MGLAQNRSVCQASVGALPAGRLPKATGEEMSRLGLNCAESVKPLSLLTKGQAFYSGNTILGDGTVILILDPNGLASTIGETARQTLSETAQKHNAKLTAEVQPRDMPVRKAQQDSDRQGVSQRRIPSSHRRVGDGVASRRGYGGICRRPSDIRTSRRKPRSCRLPLRRVWGGLLYAGHDLRPALGPGHGQLP